MYEKVLKLIGILQLREILMGLLHIFTKVLLAGIMGHLLLRQKAAEKSLSAFLHQKIKLCFTT
jgi:hypothetical protein